VLGLEFVLEKRLKNRGQKKNEKRVFRIDGLFVIFSWYMKIQKKKKIQQ